MSINDRQLAFLRGQGYTGSINDAYRTYLLAQLGVTTGSIDDLLYSYLKGRWGYTGNLNDMLFAHLRYLGYTGSLSDMLRAAWGAAGIAGFSFSANLTTSLRPEYAGGSSAPTYTRATTATVTDHENIVRPVLSGEARFQGARRVANLLPSTEDFSVAAWNFASQRTAQVADGAIAPPSVASAVDKLYEAAAVAGNTAHRVSASTNLVLGNVYIAQVRAKKAERKRILLYHYQRGAWFDLDLGTTGADATYPTTVTSTITLQSDGYYLCTMKFTANYTGVDGFYAMVGSDAQTTIVTTRVGDGASGLYASAIQLENITGRTDQTAPSEYVSTGVLSTPFHGAGVDGVKYFSTTLAGSPISESTLLGYLAEGARTNILLQSADLGTTWVPENVANAAVVTNVATAPDGIVSADKVDEKATTAAHYVVQISTSAATTHTLSVWLKSAERTKAWIYINSGANAIAYFDLSAGTVGTVSGSGSPAATITAYPNSWYRCTLTATAALNSVVGFGPTTTDNVTSYLGSANTGIYAWGAQLEAGSFASTYIPTTTASVVRNADVLTYPLAGNLSNTVGSAFSEFTSFGTATAGPRIIGSSAVANAAMYIDDSPVNFSLFDGTAERNFIAITLPTTTTNKAAVSWGGAVSDGALNGVSGTQRAFDGDLGISTAIAIAHSGGNLQLFGTIRNVRIYSAQLSASQLQAVTS